MQLGALLMSRPRRRNAATWQRACKFSAYFYNQLNQDGALFTRRLQLRFDFDSTGARLPIEGH